MVGVGLVSMEVFPKEEVFLLKGHTCKDLETSCGKIPPLSCGVTWYRVCLVQGSGAVRRGRAEEAGHEAVEDSWNPITRGLHDVLRSLTSILKGMEDALRHVNQGLDIFVLPFRQIPLAAMWSV